MIKLVQENPDPTLQVVGHTDNVGTAAATLELSRKRADSVVKALIAKGIGAARLDSAASVSARRLRRTAPKPGARTGAWSWSSSREHGHCSKLEDEGGCR